MESIIWDGKNLLEVMKFMGDQWIGMIETKDNKFILLNASKGYQQARIGSTLYKSFGVGEILVKETHVLRGH